MTPYESFLLIKNGSSNLKQLALVTFLLLQYLYYIYIIYIYNLYILYTYCKALSSVVTFIYSQKENFHSKSKFLSDSKFWVLYNLDPVIENSTP